VPPPEPMAVWIISAKRTLALRPCSFVSPRHWLRGRSVIVDTIGTVIEPGARRDPQVGGSGTAGTVREEVETPAVEGQSRACLVTCGIDIDEIPQVRRGPPMIRGTRSRRNPYVTGEETRYRVRDAEA